MIFPKTILIISKDVKFIQEIDQTIINNPLISGILEKAGKTETGL